MCGLICLMVIFGILHDCSAQPILKIESDYGNEKDTCTKGENEGSCTLSLSEEDLGNMFRETVVTDEMEHYPMFQMRKCEIANVECTWGIRGASEWGYEKMSVFLSFDLEKLANHVSKMVVQTNIDVIETDTSFSCLLSYETGDWKVCNNFYPFEFIVKASKLSQVTIKLSLKIIRIQNDDTSTGIIFHDIIRIQKQQQMQWNIDSNIAQKLTNIPSGTAIGSNIQQNQLFRILCLRKDAEYFSLNLQLINLPIPNSYSFMVKFKLSLFGKDITKRSRALFNISQPIWGFSKFLTYNDLLAGYKTHGVLQFVAEIEILNIYDKDGKEIHQDEWNSYDMNLYDYNSCFVNNDQMNFLPSSH
eukprot:1081612_1